ncbi:MAG: nuclear transport factor 2 family protein [Xanthomonadales bacterium]
MNERERIQRVVEQYVEGINSNDASGIPLTDDVRFEGAMLAEPCVGEAAVRAHLAQVAPFVTMRLVGLVVEDATAAAEIELRTVNGQTLMSAGIFDIRDGCISHHRGFTDTHRLFTGQS